MIPLIRWLAMILLPRASQDCQKLPCCSTVQSYCKESTAPSLSTSEVLGIFVTVAPRPFGRGAVAGRGGAS